MKESLLLKKIDGELILDSIKEHNIFKNAFPITIYKKIITKIIENIFLSIEENLKYGFLFC